MEMKISALILTLNEEINIEQCIDLLSWCDDIVVFDSFSSDNTVKIAKGKGARVIQRHFDDWSTHQNWALENIDFRHRWVFYMDADERCSEDLAAEIRHRLSGSNNEAAFRVRRKDFFMGKWLKHAQLYPTWLVRLFQPSKIRFERLVNPIPIVDGEIGNLFGHIQHYPFSHGISHWLARHNKYSDMEAIEATSVQLQEHKVLSDLSSVNPNLRRKGLKTLFYKLPARPLVKFIYYYLCRRGFLDGRAGLTYSILQSIYEYMIVIKSKEIELRKKDNRL